MKEKRQPTATNITVTQVVELPDKDLKAGVTTQTAKKPQQRNEKMVNLNKEITILSFEKEQNRN